MISSSFFTYRLSIGVAAGKSYFSMESLLDSESVSRHPFLRAPMHIVYLLTGVNYGIQVENGLILHSVFLAFIPVQRLADGTIQWYVEAKRVLLYSSCS